MVRDDLLHKLLVHAAVALDVPGVDGKFSHQLFFFLEVMLGVRQQARIGVGQHHLTVTAFGEKAPAQFVEQIHQGMVLLVYGLEIRHEMLVPYKSGIHTNPIT